MPLPASFAQIGFTSKQQAVQGTRKLKRLLVGTDGLTNSGKTEFALSAPGPGLFIALDRGYDGIFDNPNPPPTRRSDYAYKVIPVPTNTQGGDAKFYQPYWNEVHNTLLSAAKNPDCRTIIIDGDSDSWELQRLAEHGKLTGVFPATRYSGVYAARRALINRLHDSGKIVIATNKLKKEYVTEMDAAGNPILNNGEVKRKASGGWERQGYPDQDYLYHLQLRHLYRQRGPNAKGRIVPPQWGVKILKCKAQPGLEGEELWGSDCNFRSLIEMVYPDVPPAEWGF
jgi:hypothetical protein